MDLSGYGLSPERDKHAEPHLLCDLAAQTAAPMLPPCPAPCAPLLPQAPIVSQIIPTAMCSLVPSSVTRWGWLGHGQRVKRWPPAAGGPHGSGARGRRGAALRCQHPAAVTLPVGGWKCCARAQCERGEPQGPQTLTVGVPEPWLSNLSPASLRPSCLPQQQPWVPVLSPLLL